MTTLLSRKVLQIGSKTPNKLIKRSIISKNVLPLDQQPRKPEPWPYLTKRYTFFHQLIDRTTKRFDENTKLIVVEGPVASGKSVLAQEIASELGMLYLPEANLDMYYYNHYGFDMRSLDSQLPESCKSFDVMDFLKNPKHMLTARFQIFQYENKYSQYIDALAHILSTGQGVVLDRCCYSDFVFVEAMASHRYLSKKARCKYYEIRDCTILELMKPHLLIYIDTPVSQILENIKERNISYEVNSPVLTESYLLKMEQVYKYEYLRDMSKYCELLIYSYEESKDVEVVIEDIERLCLESDDYLEPKFQDWVHGNEEDWAVLRRYYADKKDYIMQYFNVPAFEVPELTITAEDAKIYHEVWNNAPGVRYARGYNTDMGDDGYLFKMKMLHRDTLPMRERRKVEEANN